MQVVEKAEGIVLRVSSFSNTSQMVTWLTPRWGRLTTSVKGACRPKSLFLGQYDLFYTCEVLFYARGTQGVHVLKECSALDHRMRFRTDWRAALAASYVTDVVNRISEATPNSSSLYGLLETTLNALSQNGTSAAVLLAFETRLAVLLGMTPDLEGCSHCFESALAGRARFSVPEGRLFCGACAPETEGASVVLSRKQLSLLRIAFASDVFAPTIFRRLEEGEMALLRRFLGIFLHYHMDIRLEARAIAWEALPLPRK